MKMMKLFGIITLAMLIAVPSSFACFGPGCRDDVEANAAGHVSAYDYDSMYRDAGNRGVHAYADGRGAGEYSAHAEGKRFAHASGAANGYVDPSVGAIGGRNWVAVGAKSEANSDAHALAISDRGQRNANVYTYGGVYQNNGAYIDSGFMAGVSGGNSSGAHYWNSDHDNYYGTTVRTWRGYRTICLPGMEYAQTEGGAMTAGGTFGYSETDRNMSRSFGATGNFAMGNDGVWGEGSLQTGTYINDGMSEAGAFSDGRFSYSGNGFGAGVTFGGGVSQIGNGNASASSHQTSIATGGGHGGQAD